MLLQPFFVDMENAFFELWFWRALLSLSSAVLRKPWKAHLEWLIWLPWKRYAWRSTGEWMRMSYFSWPNYFCMFSCAQFQVRLLLAEQRQGWQDKQEARGCFDIIVPLILSSRIINREICSRRKNQWSHHSHLTLVMEVSLWINTWLCL